MGKTVTHHAQKTARRGDVTSTRVTVLVVSQDIRDLPVTKVGVYSFQKTTKNLIYTVNDLSIKKSN